jgi:hypothetical protein
MIKRKHTKYIDLKKFPDGDTFSCEVFCTVQEVFGGKYVYVLSGKVCRQKYIFGEIFHCFVM